MLRRLDCAPLCDGNLAGTTVPSDVTGGPDQEPQKPELDPPRLPTPAPTTSSQQPCPRKYKASGRMASRSSHHLTAAGFLADALRSSPMHGRGICHNATRGRPLGALRYRSLRASRPQKWALTDWGRIEDPLCCTDVLVRVLRPSRPGLANLIVIHGRSRGERDSWPD